ncbi:MAG: fibrillarin-like rRNA/tRNA 2'-O-methyltransferase [Thaumarchaeota archaeon]|nr:fibrillarin-like rRNA/tRNA 2'-O-methyltransferase [Nitrososphaerota archaeon]MCL5316712.1 fibrillarin-like rRNA/tRNA 2'-O-methyltransferase [Nitrososphaerota archaeon]
MEETRGAGAGKARLRRVKAEGEDKLATLNLTPGLKVYGERLIEVDAAEYRMWDPVRSKLAAALLKGLKNLPIHEGGKVLYLGASTGTTVSHVSDLLGESGVVFAVEVAPRVAREFLEQVASKRSNVIPIVEDARRPERYRSVFSKVDVVYCDIAQPDQTEIALLNCRRHLSAGGSLLLIIKARSIDVLKDPDRVFKEEGDKIEAAGFKINQLIRLDPFDKDHALISAVWTE